MIRESGTGRLFSGCPKERTAGRLFAVSLSLLGAALGLNHGFYPAFCLCAGSALLLLYCQTHGQVTESLPPSSRWAKLSSLYLPLGLCVYTALTPGHWLKDLPIASKMLTAWVIGLAAARLPKRQLAAVLLACPLALGGSVVWTLLGGAPGEERLALGFSHPNVLGAVAAWSVVMVIVLRDDLSPRLRALALAAAACCFVGILLASSRAALFGLIVCVLFLLRHNLRRCLPGLLAGLLVLILATVWLLPAQQAARLTSLHTPLADSTFRSRLPIWEAAWVGFLQAPALGNGVRTFEARHTAYVAAHKDDLLRRYGIVEQRIGNPHHFVLGLLYMYGLVGLALFAGCLAPAVRRAWKDRDDLLPAVLLFFFTQGMFEFILHRKDGIFMLFFPLGLSCGRHLLSSQRSNHKTDYF